MASTASHREQRMGIQWRKLVFGFIPIRRLTEGRSPHIPASRLFVLFHPSKAYQPTNAHQTPPSHPKNRNIPYWYCIQCTPSLTLPPSSLKCLQKSNPNIHIRCSRCFKCFGCFRCFISLLNHKTARFWSKSELNPQTAEIVPPPYHGYGKHPKRRFTPIACQGMFLSASGIDPSLAKATKPAPGLLFISMPQKRPLVAVLNERGVERK